MDRHQRRRDKELSGRRPVDLELRVRRNSEDALGPYEASLIGTRSIDPEKPLEVLRTVHSFDPCLACAIHMVDKTNNEIVKVKAV